MYAQPTLRIVICSVIAFGAIYGLRSQLARVLGICDRHSEKMKTVLQQHDYWGISGGGLSAEIDNGRN